MTWKHKLIPSITAILFTINAAQLFPLLLIDSFNITNAWSYFFGQLNTIVCVLLGVIIYERYHQINHLICQQSNLMELVRSNEDAKLYGYLMCFSYGILAAIVQEYGYIGNFLGTLAFFVPCTMYLQLQYDISAKIQTYSGSMEMTCIRLNIAVLCKWLLRILLTTQLLYGFAMLQNHNELQWWVVRMIVIEEMILTGILGFFILTFVYDFELEQFQTTV